MQQTSVFTQVMKRDGSLAPFRRDKIEAAIDKAFRATGTQPDSAPGRVAEDAVHLLQSRFPSDGIPSVEDIQDAVEEALMAAGYSAVAKAYILYREKRREEREAKGLLGVQDELKLTVNAATVLERRYLLRDDEGRVSETPAQLFRRVAQAVADQERTWGGDPAEVEEAFFSAMANLEFMPNSPTLMNAGTPLGQLSACFVIPVEDSMAAIFDALKTMAIIHQSGGGTGFSFSKLRPKGDIVRSTHGVASGPVSFMGVFDAATNVIKQGGKRRGANMGILRVDHPDILDFIEAKTDNGRLQNFNISVAATDAFMQAVESGTDYALINPRTGLEVRRLSAPHVFSLLATSAWRSGDPGIVFIDEIERANPTPGIGRLEATNPCGELPLLANESCNLGSVNVAKMVRNGAIDWGKLGRTVRLGVRFLDNVIEANRYPLPEIEALTKGNRKIGLGVMGFAEALIMMGIAYDSEAGVALASELMAFVRSESLSASEELAAKRGPFPNITRSVYSRSGAASLRNATVNSIAPTGTISIIAGCSSGIEPLFALSFVRNVMEGTRLLEVNPLFEAVARQRGFYSPELMARVARAGSVRGMADVPADVQRVFATDFDIAPEWHVRMQAAFQANCDNAVSKTINLPEEATIDDVREAYLLAYRLKCKGITVFRYGSKTAQVLYRGDAFSQAKSADPGFVTADAEYAGGCPSTVCEF